MSKTIILKAASPEYANLLSEAFKLICDPTDWKAPISAQVPFESASLFVDAIVYHTGSYPKSTRTAEGAFLLESIGYRAGPCGDH